MRKLTILGVTLSALLLPVAAEAQFSLGARLGYAMASGDAVKDGKMSDVLKGAVPIQVDLGYVVAKDFVLGAYFSYGFGMLSSDLSDACDALNESCSASVMRLGIRGQYDFSTVSPTFVPWLGLGVGSEWASFKEESATLGFKGWEWVNLELGGDYKLNPKARLGAFVSYGFGQYGTATLEEGGDSTSASIDEKGTHNYLTFGIRGQFDF